MVTPGLLQPIKGPKWLHFRKVLIINGPEMLLLFLFKIQVSNVVQIYNKILSKQNR